MIRYLLVSLTLLLSVISTQAQTYLSDLEWAADSNYVIQSYVDGEPIWVHRDSMLNSYTAASQIAITQEADSTHTVDISNTADGVVRIRALVQNAIIVKETPQALSLSGNILSISQDETDIDLSSIIPEQTITIGESSYVSTSSWTPSLTINTDVTKYDLFLNGVKMQKVSTPTHIMQYSVTSNTFNFYETINGTVEYRGN